MRAIRTPSVRRAAVQVTAAVLGALALWLAPVSAGARPFTRAFTDDALGQRVWMTRAEHAGAGLVLIDLTWANVEPTAPDRRTAASDPGGPQFAWNYLDSMVRQYEGSRVKLALLVSQAPAWAEAPGGPAGLEAGGAWKPSPIAFGQFATALARRYSGTYPDPLHPGRTLPRVRYFQAWAEANLDLHLAPQWKRSRQGLVPTGAALYRGLLNAFYAGVKSVHRDNFVISSGLGPFGDPPGGSRTPPAAFTRELLCVRGQSLSPTSCPAPAHFDAFAIDPYEIGSPLTRALNADDVSAPDLGKLTRIVDRATRLGLALPRVHKQLWVTEFSYDSNPPNPTAVSLATQARWLEESFFVFWRQGVDVVVWYLIRDQPGRDYANTYYSGVYFYDGRPKPALQAFRFPLVVLPSGRAATVWGISPAAGTIAVEHRSGSGWATLFRTRVSAGAVFARSIGAGLHGAFRAVLGRQPSLVWIR